MGAGILTLGTLACGCNDQAVAKVELTNTTKVDGAAPASFAFRLNKIYLSEDMSKDQLDLGSVSVVWVNPSCSAKRCDYFDLTQSTQEINGRLGSEPQLTRPGTYRFVRLEICSPGANRPNIEWKTSAMPAPRELTHGACAVTSKAFDPPITLEAGDAVTVGLTYDLSSATAPMPATNPGTMVAQVIVEKSASSSATAAPEGGFADCDPSAAPQATCLKLPSFVPTVRSFR